MERQRIFEQCKKFHFATVALKTLTYSLYKEHTVMDVEGSGLRLLYTHYKRITQTCDM